MSSRTVAIIAHGDLSRDRLFDPVAARDNILERFRALRDTLRTEGYSCHTADLVNPAEVDFLLFHDYMNELDTVLRTVRANPGVYLIYVPNEPKIIIPLHDERILPRLPADLILTWNDRIAAKYPRVFKCNIGQPVINAQEIPVQPFADKKFICSIFAFKPSGEHDTLFQERIRAVDFFNRKPEGIDLFGIGWDDSGLPFVNRAYRGSCASKLGVQKNYRFALAFENTASFPGLITEKIFDCFAAGTVPIYLGAPNIEAYIPVDSFVDARCFADYQKLYEYLVEMPESRYQEYLLAAKTFLCSDQYQQFTSSSYAKLVTQKIGEVGERPVCRSPLKLKWDLLKRLLSAPGVMKNWRGYRRLGFSMIRNW